MLNTTCLKCFSVCFNSMHFHTEKCQLVHYRTSKKRTYIYCQGDIAYILSLLGTLICYYICDNLHLKLIGKVRIWMGLEFILLYEIPLVYISKHDY
jgi:hypothetical protein